MIAHMRKTLQTGKEQNDRLQSGGLAWEVGPKREENIPSSNNASFLKQDVKVLSPKVS